MIFGITYWRRLLNSSKQDPIRKAAAKKEKTERADSNQERKELVRDELVGKSKPFVSSSFPTVPKSSSSEKAVDNPATFAELDSDKSTHRDDATDSLEAESGTIPEAENEIQVDLSRSNSANVAGLSSAFSDEELLGTIGKDEETKGLLLPTSSSLTSSLRS